MRTHWIEKTRSGGVIAQPPDRQELGRWLLLGGMGLGLTALALAPLAHAEDLMGINGQQHWMAALEIPFGASGGKDMAPRLHFGLENERIIENGRHVASVGYQWVLGNRAEDRRQQGFYVGNEFNYTATDYDFDTTPALFYRSGKMILNDQSQAEFSQLSTGAQGVLVLGALVGIVLAVSSGTNSDAPAPAQTPPPPSTPTPTPKSAAAGVVGQALSPSSIAGFFNKAFSNAGSGGNSTP